MPKKSTNQSLVKKDSANKKRVARGRVAEEVGKDEVLATSQVEAEKRVRVSQSSFRTGQLPTPRDFAAYNEVIPDGAERAMRIIESEQSAKNKELLLIMIEPLLRLILSFILGLGLLIVFVIVALYAPNPYAFIALGGLGSIVPLGGLIYYGLGRRK